MSDKKKYSCKVTLCALDFKDRNRYNAIRFETLHEKPIPISSQLINLDLKLDEEDFFDGKYTENVYLIPSDSKMKEKKYVYTFFCGIDNIINLNVNEEGDCGIEITLMWDIDYGDDGDVGNDDISISNERQIPDIKYNGKEVEKFEKLYERKRYTILNAKIDNLEKDIFSDESLEYLKNNKNKSYKYDILLNKDNQVKLLSEKVIETKAKYLEKEDKKSLAQKIQDLKSELYKKFEDMESKEKKYGQLNSEKVKDKQVIRDLEAIEDEIDKVKFNLNLFLNNKLAEYKSLDETFKLYNKKWNLEEFSEDDFKLFLSFSEIQLYFKTYKSYKSIQSNIRNIIGPEYNKLKENVVSNKSLTFVEKARIICSFSKFCSSELKDFNFPELVFIDNLKEDDPYKLAIDKLKNILNNLKESSGLFKLLLLFDMGSNKIINEWDFMNFEVLILNYDKVNDTMHQTKSSFKKFKSDFIEANSQKKNSDIKCENITFPILSMLSLETVSKHSLDLLPKFFFKAPKICHFNALTFGFYRITFYNVDRILDNYEFEKTYRFLSPESCVVPLILEIFHESYSHLKIRYSDINKQSPLLNPIKGQYKLLCTNNYLPESGYFLEYFFAEDYFELKFLKSRNNHLFSLSDSKYWLDVNFKKMKKCIKESIRQKFEGSYISEDEFYEMVSYNKRRYNDEDGNNIFRCIFKKYNP